MAEKTVYCTIEDVQTLVKRTQFTDDSKVTSADVKEFIDRVCSIIDGELMRLGVTLPIPASAKATRKVLCSLASFEVASWAESTAFFGSNKNESNHAKWLHEQYTTLLNSIRENPAMLYDVVQGNISHMKSSTEDMLEGGSEEGDEVFTKKHIGDFVSDNKILSPSEEAPNSGTITGGVDRTRV